MEHFIKSAQDAIAHELEGVKLLAANIPEDFGRAAKLIASLSGRLIVSGMGKSGYIGQKIAASFASTGTRSFYMHPAEASHGDLGMIGKDDVVLLLSNSGETKELTDIIYYCNKYEIPIIGITMNKKSLLGQSSNYLLNIPKIGEASSVNAPTTSSTMMIVLGDALMIAVHEVKGFSVDEFAIFHPGGKLGAKFAKVSGLMHKDREVPYVLESSDMQNAVLEMTSKGFGCTAVLDSNNKIIGIITDGDLRRKMSDQLFHQSVSDVMTKNPVLIEPSTNAFDALKIMNQHKITSIFVAENHELRGVIHIHDLLRAGLSLAELD